MGLLEPESENINISWLKFGVHILHWWYYTDVREGKGKMILKQVAIRKKKRKNEMQVSIFLLSSNMN